MQTQTFVLTTAFLNASSTSVGLEVPSNGLVTELATTSLLIATTRFGVAASGLN